MYLRVIIDRMYVFSILERINIDCKFVKKQCVYIKRSETNKGERTSKFCRTCGEAVVCPPLKGKGFNHGYCCESVICNFDRVVVYDEGWEEVYKVTVNIY